MRQAVEQPRSQQNLLIDQALGAVVFGGEPGRGTGTDITAATATAIPVILDGIVGASRQVLCNLGPAISQASMQPLNELLLFLTKGALPDRRIQMIVPSKIIK